MPALSLTLLSFGIILALGRFKVPLWLAIVCGAASLGLFFGSGVQGLGRSALAGVLQSTSIGLLLAVALLLMLSEAMRRTGRMERMVVLIQSLVRRPVIALAALPALIGLLPMPGGAIFSAPMVRQAAHGNKMENELLATINYWWRHIWEHWWPMYPGVILAMSLTNSDLMTFALSQIPLGIFMTLCGLLLFRSLPPALLQVGPPPPQGIVREVLMAVAPIALVLMVWGGAGVVINLVLGHYGLLDASQDWVSFVKKFASLLLGLMAGLIYALWARPFPFKSLGRLMLNKEMAPLLGLVVGIMVYQGVLKDVNAASAISRELAAAHVPVTLVVIVLPFIAGLLTGVAFGFVGVSFPLVLSLLEAMPDQPTIRPYVVLAYAAGHIGMMVSPIHLCYVVSNRYFETTFGATMRLQAWPLIGMSVATAVYFLFLKWVL